MQDVMDAWRRFRNAQLDRRATRRLQPLEEVVAHIEQMYSPGSSTLSEMANDMFFWAESAPGRNPEYNQYLRAIEVVERRHPNWLYLPKERRSFSL